MRSMCCMPGAAWSSAAQKNFSRIRATRTARRCWARWRASARRGCRTFRASFRSRKRGRPAAVSHRAAAIASRHARPPIRRFRQWQHGGGLSVPAAGRRRQPTPRRPGSRLATFCAAVGGAKSHRALCRRQTWFGGRTETPPALRDVTFALGRGECLGVVGESGSGKSTLGRAVLQMIPYEGHVLLDGQDLAPLRGLKRRAQRRRLQVVFQDPRESMNPRLRIGDIVAEPLRLQGGSARPKTRRHVAALLGRVGLNPELALRLPGARLRRPGAAHRHRPRPGGGAGGDRARRADLGARCLDPGDAAEPAEGSRAERGAVLHSHQP